MLLNLLDGKEVVADIEVASAPGEARIVEDGAFLEGDAAVGGVEDVDREHLHEGLEGVEKPCLGVGTDEDALRLDLQQVALIAQLGVDGVVDGEKDAVGSGGADKGGTHMHFAQGVGYVFGCGGVLSQVLEAEASGRGKGEGATFEYAINRFGDDIVV